MTDALQGLMDGFAAAFSVTNLFWVFFGVAAGTIIGVLPGLGTPATIAILLPLSVNLDPATALIMMAGIYYGSKYGGSTTSILLNIPGEDASVVTALDGYQMARKGRAGPALGIAAIGSFIAGTVGLIGLTADQAGAEAPESRWRRGFEQAAGERDGCFRSETAGLAYQVARSQPL